MTLLNLLTKLECLSADGLFPLSMLHLGSFQDGCATVLRRQLIRGPVKLTARVLLTYIVPLLGPGGLHEGQEEGPGGPVGSFHRAAETTAADASGKGPNFILEFISQRQMNYFTKWAILLY